MSKTIEEYVADAEFEIKAEIGSLVDRMEVLLKLLPRIKDMAGGDIEQLLKETRAWEYYCSQDFRALLELSDNFEAIKAGEY